MKKKNILLKEQEKLAKEYKKKYENSMKNVTSLQNKLNITNTKHRKTEIMYESLKENYRRLSTLFEKQKTNNYESIRRLTQEQTEYWNMVQERRFTSKKNIRRVRHRSNRRLRHSSLAPSKEAFSKTSMTETDLAEDKHVEKLVPELVNAEELEDKFDIFNRSLTFELASKRYYSVEKPFYEKLSLEEHVSFIKTVVSEKKLPPKPTADVKIQTDDIELYKISTNHHLFTFSQDTYLTPVEARLMEKLKKESKTGSRQNKIISLLMNNPEYNLRVQNVFHSDKLNALLDSEYMLPLYYNTLYNKIDKLLGGGEDFEYGSQPTGALESEDNQTFTEVDLDNSDEEYLNSRNFNNLPKDLQSTLLELKKGQSFIRKPPIHKSPRVGEQKRGSRDKRESLVAADHKFDPEQEQLLYEETKALLDEEIDGFDDPDEFEAELPRRIREAMENLNERMKHLKKDEFGDPIIEDGYLDEPQGKNLQLSALRLTNLLSMLFKKNPLPEFQEPLSKLLKNLTNGGKISLDDMKSKILSGKGLGGVLNMLQKNMQKTSSITKNMSEYPPGFNPSRRSSSFLKNDPKDKMGNKFAEIAKSIAKLDKMKTGSESDYLL